MSGWRTPPPPIPQSDIQEEFTADVVIVGLGYSGTAALRAAAESGAQVIGLEAMPERSFTTFGRDIGHINSDFLKSRGVPPVDPLELFNEWMARAGNRANPALIMQYVKHSGAAFDWFTDPYGVDGLGDVHVAFWPDASPKFDGVMGAHRFWRGTAQFPEPRGWKGHPTLTELVRANQKKAKELGAQVHFGTEAVQIECSDGRATAILAKARAGGYRRYTARKAILLAAGDFSGNPEMMADLLPDIQDLFQEGEGFRRMMGRTGRGIQLSVWAGGRLEPRPLPTMGGNYNTLAGVTGTFGILWLDPDGKRYCNESFGDPVFTGFPGAQHKPGTYYHIFDSNVWQALDYSVPAHGGFDAAEPKQPDALRSAMEGAVRAGPGGVTLEAFGQKTCVAAGSTWEELARNAGLSADQTAALLKSVQRYNALCRSGRDEDFGKDAKLMIPLDHPPYFLQTHPYSPAGFMLVTVGGLLTDERQNVLGQDYRPIPGLYATGNCCGRRFGPQYSTPISGVSIGIAITLGRLAGRNVAEGSAL